MKNIGLFEAKNRLSEVCNVVSQTKEPCVITRHGKPWVRIVPLADEASESVWATVAEGRRRYGAIEDNFTLPERSVSNNRPSPL